MITDSENTNISSCIILADDADQTEYLRARARFGKSSFGMRIMKLAQFAEFVLTRAGVPITEKIIGSDEQAAITAHLIKDIDYFSSSSYSDAGKIAAALNSVRELINGDEGETIKKLSQGEFPEKNRALLRLYSAYTDYCRENNLMDSVGYKRKALKEREKAGNVAALCLGRHYSGLDYQLACDFSGSSGFTFLKKPDMEITDDCIGSKKAEFVSAYGAVNEVDYILSEILENNIPLDRCIVAVTDTAEYGSLFYDRGSELGIPMTFGCGIPVSCSKVAGFLKLLYAWDSDGLHGIDALHNLIYSDAFSTSRVTEILGENSAKLDDIITVAGNLHLDTSADENKRKISAYRNLLLESSEKNRDKILLALDGAEKLFSEFEKGYSAIIKTFAFTAPDPASPEGKIDRSAVKAITSAIDAYLEYSGSSDIGEIIPGILGKAVCHELSREGALHITDINSASYAMRENIFIAGLSASKFPGVPTENYIMLDSDYALCTGNGFVSDEVKRPTSFRITEEKINSFEFLVETAEACRADIHISYPDFDFAELKSDEPSSVFSKYLERSSGGEEAGIKIKNAGFFTLRDGRSCEIGRAAAQGKIIIPEEHDQEEYVMPAIENTEAYISPSSADIFTTCPQKYLFEKLLDLKPFEEHKPAVVIDAAAEGTLLHSAMEFRGDKNISADEFIKYCNKLFDDFLISKPALNEADEKAARDEFISLAEKTFRLYNDKSVALSEEYIEYTSGNTGITAGGYPDRIIYDGETDSYIIVDFKSGRNIKQETDDFASCIQALLYAYIYSKITGNKVTGVEYRYPRYGKTVTHKFNEDISGNVEEYIFDAMAECLKSGIFRAAYKSSDDRCRYCDYRDICPEVKK